jgi:hypothetical protein
MLPKIIAICGAKRSGKDCIAKIISSQYDYEHIKIARKLKDVCHILFGFTEEQMETDLKDQMDPRWDVTPRTCMQFLGTEVMQFKIQEILPTVQRNFWIKSLIANLDPEKNYVISDLRFIHEYNELKHLDAVIIRVDRDVCDGCNDTHSSEQEYKQLRVDHIIKNNGTKHELNRAITQILPSVDH